MLAPYNVSLTHHPQAMKAEPKVARIPFTLAQLYLKYGRGNPYYTQEIRRLLSLAVTLNPPFPAAKQLLDQLDSST